MSLDQQPLFGSDIGAIFVRTVLEGLEPVTNVIGDRLYNLLGYPDDSVFPAGLHYMESNVYGGVTSGRVTSSEMRYTVRFTDVGESNEVIKPAAIAAAKALNGARGVVEYDGDYYYVTTALVGEYPVTQLQERGNSFRQLGYYLAMTVTNKGGF